MYPVRVTNYSFVFFVVRQEKSTMKGSPKMKSTMILGSRNTPGKQRGIFAEIPPPLQKYFS